VRGFILQPTYRIEAGRPVLMLHGRLESGATFLVRETREVPHFFVRAADAERARALGAVACRGAPERRTLDGEAVARVELAVPADATALRAGLAAAGIPCFEADVRFAWRYLIDRGIRASVQIDGIARPGDGIDAVFDDPRVGPADWTPTLSVLSLDIETDPRASRLLSAALHGCGCSEVLLLTPPGAACPAGATPAANERELLGALVRRIREIDPDVLTGWNVIGFDLAVLLRLAQRCGVPFAIGRGPGTVRLRTARGGRGAAQAFVPGRLVLDGIDLLRGAFVRLESYSLDGAAREILGRGKLITGADRAEQILAAFEGDRAHLVAYNLDDARLVLEILERLRLVELSVERSRLTGLPPDRVASSIAAFDFLYLSELTRRGTVAPTAPPAAESGAATAGGHVLEPRPGLWRNVMVFDFRSLYPSIIRTFQIDPVGRLRGPGPHAGAIVAPNGAAFGRTPAILPGILDELFPRREAARAAGDRVTSQAIKILMNSFYGVLAHPACRFADPELVNAITSFGREILLWSRERIERAGFEVLYGDTDSLFVRSDCATSDAARGAGNRLAGELNAALADHVAGTWGVDSRLALEFDRLYLRLFLPALRHGTAGARKRYVGLVEEDGRTRVAFTGMEVVRRDWTALARQVQRELYERLFADLAVDDYLREIVVGLRAGRLDELLVYRKALRKDLAEYTASTPPHVAAARRGGGRTGRVVAYVMTTAGPELAGSIHSPIDHEHYVQRQLRPVAEPVLAELGLDFDRVVGDDAQLRLFP